MKLCIFRFCLLSVVQKGDASKAVRRSVRKSDPEDAAKNGLSHDFIRQIESEKTRCNFSVETFCKISRALDVSMDVLAQEDEQA